jgi:hypothetical protein
MIKKTLYIAIAQRPFPNEPGKGPDYPLQYNTSYAYETEQELWDSGGADSRNEIIKVEVMVHE